MTERETITTKEAALMMGVSYQTMLEMVHRPGFPCIMVGRRRIIPVEAFRKWMNEQKNEE